jgi:hypothetical protein
MNIFVSRHGKIDKSATMKPGWQTFLSETAPREISTALGMDISPLLKHQNIVITQEIVGLDHGWHGEASSRIGKASRGIASFGIPWDFRLTVYHPDGYAHEFAHLVHFLSGLKNLVGFDSREFHPDPDTLPAALERIIDDVTQFDDPEVANDEYLNGRAEWFARMFEVHISWRLSDYSISSVPPLIYWTLPSYSDPDSEPWHIAGYTHASYWYEYQPRFHRAIRSLLRDLIAFMEEETT